MPSDVDELSVFIASPSDLKDERAVLRSLEADLNSKFAPANIRVRMTGWEERPPAYGRPQGQINPMVDACDVFVGLLRRRWGSPTGTHESGFEEEFERALERRQRSGDSPEISIFFAQLSQDEIDDAGPDLTRVLAFQERLRTERVGIYSTFTGPHDLGTQVSGLLERHLIQLVISQGAYETPTGTEGVPDSTVEADSRQVEEAPTDTQKDEARSQLSGALAVLQGLLSDQRPEHPLDRDRIEFIGTALGRDDPLLGTHLTNRLYQRRDELDLIVAEHTAWVRTLLGDIGRATEPAGRVIPGWAIIQRDHNSFEPLMLRAATESGVVGVGALRSMQRLGIRPPTLWPRTLRLVSHDELDPSDDDTRLDNWTNVLNAHPGRSAAMTYLLQDLDTEDEKLAQALDEMLASIQLRRGDLNDESRQFIAQSRQALAGEPSPLAEALGYSSEVNAPWRQVIRHIEKLDLKRLNQLAAQTFNRTVRIAAVKAGFAASALTDVTLKSLLFQEDRELTGLVLASARSEPDNARHYLSLMEDKPDGKVKPVGLEAMLLALCATPEELLELDAQKTFSNVPWEAFTHLEPDEAADPARTVLLTDASELRARLFAVIGSEHEVIDYLATDRKRVAAALLARRDDRSAEDVELVIHWFEELAATGFVHGYAFDTLAEVVDEATVSRVSEVLARHSEVTGVRLSYDRVHGPLAPALAPLFLHHESGYLREPAMLWHTLQRERSDDELREALYDKSEKVRVVAAKILASRFSDDQVKLLLDDYPKAERAYWYNVIAAFDELLYAPSAEETQ